MTRFNAVGGKCVEHLKDKKKMYLVSSVSSEVNGIFGRDSMLIVLIFRER